MTETTKGWGRASILATHRKEIKVQALLSKGEFTDGKHQHCPF